MPEMRKVIYSYIEPDKKVEIPKFLKRNYEWEPVVFSFNSTDKKGMENFFPKAFIANEGELRANIFNYKGLKKKPIDFEIIQKLKPFENNFLSMIKEPYPGAVSFYDRRNYYYEILNYWNTIILETKPDIYISYTQPHNEATYALYLMCKYIHSVKVIFLDDYVVFENNYFFNNNINDQSLIFKNYKIKDLSEISETVKNYFLDFQKKPESPTYISDYISFFSEDMKISNQLKIIILDLFKVIKNLFTSRKFLLNNSYYKMYRNEDIMSLTAIDNLYYKIILKIKNFKSKKYYESLSEKEIPKENFIFFAPSVQPEYTGNLRTGIYEDHILVLDLLSSNLPPSWKIIFKEHPAQFTEPHASLSKDKFYYKKIKKMKNVKILSQSINSYELMEKSSVVACTGSTIGMDAMIMGKPCLLFGNTWFNSCKSVININTKKDLTEAFKKITSGYKPDKIDLMSYMDFVYSLSTKLLTLFISKNFKNKYLNNQFDQNIDLTKEYQKVALNFYKNYERFYGK